MNNKEVMAVVGFRTSEKCCTKVFCFKTAPHRPVARVALEEGVVGVGRGLQAQQSIKEPPDTRGAAKEGCLEVAGQDSYAPLLGIGLGLGLQQPQFRMAKTMPPLLLPLLPVKMGWGKIVIH